MAEGCREKARQYKIDDEGIPTNTTKEQVTNYHVQIIVLVFCKHSK